MAKQLPNQYSTLHLMNRALFLIELKIIDIYMCFYTYICIYICMYVYIQCMYVCIYIYTYIYICVHIYIVNS